MRQPEFMWMDPVMCMCRILVMTAFSAGLPGATIGTTVAGGNGYGGNANQLTGPWGVSIDGSGNVYVADQVNNRIQRWAPGADTGITVAGGKGSGVNANQLSRPTGVYVDGFGNVYVSDRDNHRIQRWAPGADTGSTVAGGNRQGVNANQLNRPNWSLCGWIR